MFFYCHGNILFYGSGHASKAGAVELKNGGNLACTVQTNGLQMNKPIRDPVSTVAALPSGAQGMRAMVNDANATTFDTTVAGGGSNIVPVFYNGTNWRIG